MADDGAVVLQCYLLTNPSPTHPPTYPTHTTPDQQDGDVQYEEVDVADEPQPRVIETGDSVKVKQVLDDATTETYVNEGVFEPNYVWENIKLVLMFLSCVFAMVAQFYPIPFPSSRPLLGVCCAMYFVLSSVLQFMITYIDKDIILVSKPEKSTGKTILVRTNFPRFQEYFTLVVQYQEKDTTGGKVMHVCGIFLNHPAIILCFFSFSLRSRRRQRRRPRCTWGGTSPSRGSSTRQRTPRTSCCTWSVSARKSTSSLRTITKLIRTTKS